ncbi:MAG TPA: hypothetical protein VKF62_05525, partial [Planctomycetota bacterium]|nr:hypothetical protein [Planctomycetota bacterium]
MVLRTAALAVLLASGAAGARSVDEGSGLVVHEWGTFTAVMGDDGLPVEWRPLSGTDDLPEFVYRRTPSGALATPDARSVKLRLAALARLETPVVYFYSDRPVTASARVAYPGGWITEWYPQARRRRDTIRWDGIEVRPGIAGAFPDDGSRSHYYAARETDAAALRIETDTGTQEEGFLFYRGAGSVGLSLSVVCEGGFLRVPRLENGVRDIVVVSNRGGRMGYSLATPEGKAVSLRDGLPGGDVPSLQDELRRLLVRHGLYPKEAAAMVATWGDSWFEEGTRVFYVLPRAEVDRALPLTVTPPPSETARVLVGRLELVLPEDEERARAEVDRLPDPPSA